MRRFLRIPASLRSLKPIMSSTPCRGYIGWQWWQYDLNGCSVHRLDSPLSRQPLLLAVIVNHLVLVLVLYRDYCHYHIIINHHISNWTCILPPASLLITRAPRATSNSPFDTGSIQTCSPWFLNILNILRPQCYFPHCNGHIKNRNGDCLCLPLREACHRLTLSAAVLLLISTFITPWSLMVISN